MQRPTKVHNDLTEPLLPPKGTVSGEEVSEDTKKDKKPYRFSFRNWIRGFIIIYLTGNLFWQFARPQETVLFLPGEWMVLGSTLVVVVQTQVLTKRPQKASLILDLYALFLVTLRLLLPVNWICNVMAMAIVCQSVLIGIEMRIMMRSMERVNLELEQDDFDSSKTHWGFQCDGCNVTPIVGIRYRSKQESEYDLCESCMIELQQRQQTDDDKTNSFIKIQNPLPVPNDLLKQSRREETYLRRQRQAERERAAHEARVLASIDPKEAATMNTV